MKIFVRLIVVGVLAMVAPLCVVVPASAQPKAKAPPSPAALAKARRLFASAARAYDAGRFDVAVQAFDQAYELAPRVSLRFSAAQSLRRLYAQDPQVDHLHKALRYYRQYLDEVKEGRRVKDAAEAVNALEFKLEKLAPPAPTGNDDDDDDDDGRSKTPPKPEPAPKKAFGTLDLNSAPAGAVASIVGRTSTHELPKWIDLPPGEYKVSVTAPGFLERTITIRISTARVTVVDASLKEQPALLELTGDEGCDVVVDGRAMGRTPLLKPIELPSGSHRVNVGQTGRAMMSQRLLLQRGKKKALAVDLSPTVQRGLAWGFLGVGGAATVTGVVFAALAGSRGSKAVLIANRREEEGRDLTLAEAEEHNALLQTGQNLVTASSVSIAAGLVAGGVGFALYVFDEPDLLNNQDAGQENDEAKLLPLPMVGATPAGEVVVGVMLAGQF